MACENLPRFLARVRGLLFGNLHAFDPIFCVCVCILRPAAPQCAAVCPPTCESIFPYALPWLGLAEWFAARCVSAAMRKDVEEHMAVCRVWDDKV